jgi:hypothetical protein
VSRSSAQGELLRGSVQGDKFLIKDKKFKGFDFLRAIFSIAIVADHANLFTLATIGSITIWTDLLYANFSYIAVPVFLQISLFLFYLKSEKPEFHKFFRKRIIRLISLYLFWVVTLLLFSLVFKEGSPGISKLATLSVRGWIEFIVSGGNSPFYFFFSLIFLTTLAAILVLFFNKLGNFLARIRVSYCLLFISCALVFCFSAIDPIISNNIGTRGVSLIQIMSNIAHWDYNPLNFLPYIFTAAIVVQELNHGKLNNTSLLFQLKLWSLFFLFLIFTLLEWASLESLTHYSRLSLVFGSWLLLYLAILSKREVPHIVRLISECSLGIYTLHLFFTHVFFVGNANFLSVLSDITPGLGILSNFFLALIGSIALTFLFKKIEGLKKLV